MRKVAKTMRDGSGGRRQLQKRRSPSSRSTKRVAPAACIDSPGQRAGESLPSLAGVRTRYVHEGEAQLLHRLCVALAERNLADLDLWRASEEIPGVFAQTAVSNLIHKIAGTALNDTLTYVCAIRDDLCDEGYLAATFEVHQGGCMKIGGVIEEMEKTERFLGASFYLLLLRSLYRRMWVYTHHDAEYYKEEMEEWRDAEDPESRDAYEIPAVEEAIPESVQALEKIEGRDDPHTMRARLRRHIDGPHGLWIRKLLNIHRLSRLHAAYKRFEEEFDSGPAPSVLILFKEHDAIEACFDQEQDRFQDYNRGPTCGVSFRPEIRDEFDQALRAMTIFLRLNRELAELITLLNKWEDQHVRRHQHRAEPPLRAQ